MSEKWKDPIVDEIHQVRERIASECGNDLKRIIQRFREREKQHPERVVKKIRRSPDEAAG